MKPKSNRKTDPAIDRCQTPPYALTPLFPFLKKQWRIWECAAGDGLMATTLLDRGYTVIASDILTGQDFFEVESVKWDCIITNPPYSKKYEWLARCYELGKPFALLMPVETIGAKRAQILFEQYGFEWILMDKRINFKMPYKGWNGNGAQFPTAWFTWKLGIGKSVTFAKIDRNT